MDINPFSSSDALASWASAILVDQNIDQIASWRMLEYWMQAELYRTATNGQAGAWKYIGEYEQSYHTETPRSGSKTNTKWVDLIFGELENELPKRVVWIELKDLGRSKGTMEANLKCVGMDLAALYGLRIPETRQLWLNPPPHAVDKGRQNEWNSISPWLDVSEHLIAQIIIVPHSLIEKNPDEISKIWLDAFEARAKPDKNHGIKISWCDMPSTVEEVGLSIYALVVNLPQVVI